MPVNSAPRPSSTGGPDFGPRWAEPVPTLRSTPLAPRRNWGLTRPAPWVPRTIQEHGRVGKCCRSTRRGSRISGRATSSRSIAPPATTSRCNHPVGLPWAAARRWPGRCPWGVFRGKSGAGLGDNLDAAPLSGLARPCQAEFNATRRRSTKCVPPISPPGTRRRWVP